jgi:predicted permease
MLADLKFALRQLQKNPGYTAIAVLTLALGIGANTALFSLVHGVLLRPLPFHEPDRLMTLWESNPARGIDQRAVSPPNFRDWREQNDSFAALAYWTGPFDFNLVTLDGTEKVQASFASANLFSLLGIAPSFGRGFAPEDDEARGRAVAVISHAFWQQHFAADPDVLGRTFTVDTYGRRTYTVIGVMPAGFQFPGDTAVWMAAGWNGLPADRRTGPWLNVLGRLKDDVRLSQARAEMNGVQTRIARAHPGLSLPPEVDVVPLLHQTVGRPVRTGLLVLWGVVAGILLIACANVASLTLSRAAGRRREIAVRLALGASRGRVLRQLFMESLLLSLIGGAAGLLAGHAGVSAFVAFGPGDIPRLSEVSVDRLALGFTTGITVLTAFVFGLAPAWQGSGASLTEAMNEGGRSASGGLSAGRARAMLVVAEVALATVLLVGAGLMLQSLARLLATDRGVRPEQVLLVELDFSISGFTTWVQPTATRPQVRLQELMERVRQLPGVQAAGASYGFFRRDNRPAVQTFSLFGQQGAAAGERPVAEPNAITPDYLRTLGIRLLRGRDFTEADTLEAPGVVLVNESFVRRFLPNVEPLGQYLTMEGNPGPLSATNRFGQSIWSEIVGVVSDVKSVASQPAPAPEIYRPYWQWPMQSPKLFVRASGEVDTTGLTAAIRRETKSVIPNLPSPRIRRLTEVIGETTAQPRFQAGLLSLFGVLAIVLAAGGIYGVLACSVAQRQRELGVRIALGAGRRNIFTLIIGQGLRLTLLGIGLGLAASLAATRVLVTLLYGVPPIDPMTWLAVAALLSSVALLACWLPARRAARVNPIEALRAE